MMSSGKRIDLNVVAQKLQLKTKTARGRERSSLKGGSVLSGNPIAAFEPGHNFDASWNVRA
jgi:hypothetical protein